MYVHGRAIRKVDNTCEMKVKVPSKGVNEIMRDGVVVRIKEGCGWNGKDKGGESLACRSKRKAWGETDLSLERPNQITPEHNYVNTEPLQVPL